MIRMCCHLNHSCDCDDVAAQPCIASLIADYLKALQWNVLAKGAEGAPVIRWKSHKHIVL